MDERHDDWCETIARQATDDQSVIDHLIHVFSPLASVPPPREPISVQSAAIYEQIRKTETAEYNYQARLEID